MIVHSSAIVLKTIDYSESSKIITLFTKEHGKIGVMARGAKRPKSKFAGLLETGNLLDVVSYYKASRSVQTLSEAAYLKKTLNIRLHFDKMGVMMSGLELISQLLHEHEVNHRIFDFAKNFLIWLNDADIKPARIFPYLQIRLAHLMGIGLRLESTVESPSNIFLNVDSGLISTQKASSHSYRLSKDQYRYIVLALQARTSLIFSIALENEALKELVEYLDRYLRFHIEGLRNRKSDAVFDQILNT
jgi:DNA repair protein RecO